MNYILHLSAFFSYVKADNRLTCAHVSLYMALFQYWNYNRFRNPFPVYRDNIMQLSKIGSKDSYYRCIKDLHQAGYIFYNPSVSKFHPVKISIVRLDKTEEKNEATQLDIFNASLNSNLRNPDVSNSDIRNQKPTPKIRDYCPEIGTHDCPENRTVCVLNSVPMCPEIGTGTVLKSGHLIKQNIINNVCKHTQVFEKNKKVAQAINGFVSVPKSTSKKSEYKTGPDISRMPAPPTIEEVESFFVEKSYPITEAQKFFYYNNGKAWMLNDNVAISDWHSLAHKWMLNEKSKANKTQQSIYHTENKKDYSEPL